MILTLGPSLVRIIQLVPEAELVALGERMKITTAADEFLSTLHRTLLDNERVTQVMDHLSLSAREFLAQVMLHGGAVSWETASQQLVGGKCDRPDFLFLRRVFSNVLSA